MTSVSKFPVGETGTEAQAKEFTNQSEGSKIRAAQAVQEVENGLKGNSEMTVKFSRLVREERWSGVRFTELRKCGRWSFNGQHCRDLNVSGAAGGFGS